MYRVRAAASQAPDLILLDVMMPEMDGYEVLARLRGDSGHLGHLAPEHRRQHHRQGHALAAADDNAGQAAGTFAFMEVAREISLNHQP